MSVKPKMVKKPTYEELKQRIRELETKLAGPKSSEGMLCEQPHEPEEKYPCLVDLSFEGIVRYCEGKIVYINNRGVKLLGGGAANDIIGKPVMDFVHPDDKDLVINTMQTLEKGNVAAIDEARFIGIDGRELTVEVARVAVNYQETPAIQVVFRDITDLKLKEKALRESEERYRSLTERTSDWIWEVDRNGIYTYANPKVKDILGYESDEVIGKTPFEFMLNDEAQRVTRLFQDIVRSKKPFQGLENTCIHRDGRPVTLETSGVPILDTGGNLWGYRGVDRDISKRKQAEEALRASERRYRLLIENIPTVAWVTSQNDQTVFISSNVEKVYGYNTDEVLSKGDELWFSRIHPDDTDHVNEAFRSLFDQNTKFNVEYRVQRKDGQWIWIHDRANIVEGKAGEHLAYGVFSDITDRKRAEEALRESEERLSGFMNSASDSFYLLDSNLNFIEINKKGLDLIGKEKDELIGKNITEIVPDIKKSGRYEKYFEVIRTGKTFETDDFIPHPKFGDLHFILKSFKVGKGVGVIATDITERKRAEGEKEKLQTQLQQAQKMEAIGTLAGGIAHDFNNLLMGIQGRASLMSVELDASHPHSEHICAIEEYIRSATGLTKQLLGFARGGKYEVKTTDMNELVLNSATMFGRTKREIQIHTKLYNPTPVVEADRRQIEQVLLNMYVNAWQAMPDGGELYLETRIVTLDDEYCKPYQVEPGPYVKVSVTDTGCGMDEATRQRVFDPFFTTQAMGRGTGLGLASTYGIIKNHRGMTTVYSEGGHGTTFNFYLPISNKVVNRETAPVDGKLIRGSETILLVDDEEMIIDVGQAMLERLGYRVFAAQNGQRAVEAVTEMGDEIDLVIIDMIMPGMDGGKTFDQIREIQPEIPVMLSSGYALSGQANEIMRRGCNGFIQKPFNISEFSKQVRQILEEAKKLIQP